MKPQLKSLSVIKLFLLLFLPVLILVSTVAFLFYYTKKETINNERLIFQTSEVNHVGQQLETITNSLNNIKSDLLILSGHKEMQNLLDTGDTHYRNDIAEEFLIFCSAKEIYGQTRFINEKGMEIVRINYNSGNPHIVQEDLLQYKGDRYYFNDTFTLNNKDEIYVSPFDLNIEGGEIERPLKPMIRFGIVVYDRQRQKRGIIVLNYLGENLLNQLRVASQNNTSHTMLLNSNGYWLQGIKPEDEWGFMYKDRKDLIFGNAFPDAWKQISTSSSGHFHNDAGFFTYNTVYPFQKSRKHSWKIVSYVESDILSANFSSYIVVLFSIYGSMIVLIGCGLWFLASSTVSQRKAEEELKQSDQRFRQYFDLGLIGMAITSPEKGWVEFNDVLCKMFGYSREDFSS